MTVTDELGLSNTTTHQVTVDAAPAASFSASPSPATVGPSVAFDGSGSSDTLGSITSYSWEFGDGATGSGPTASHPYATPGRYTVKLKVTNDAGQTATVSHSVTVDAPPKALFSVSPTAVTTGAAVAFNASSSSDDVGTITDYSWSFGDGTPGQRAYGEPFVRQPRHVHGRADGDQRRRAEHLLQPDRLGLLRTS